MKKYRALIFDIDWTLFDHKNHRFNPETIEALKKIQKEHPEILLFLCTSRPYGSFKELGTLDLGIDWDGYVASSGALVYTDNQYLKKILVKHEDILNFINSAAKHDLCFEMIGLKDRILFGTPNSEYDEFYKIYSEVKAPHGTYRGQEVTGFTLFSNDKTDEAMKKENPNLIFSRFEKFASDVISAPHEKGPALELLLNHYGIEKEEAMGFGDDLQDISLAKHVGTFVALGNAKPEVKEVAHYVSEPVYEKGLSTALRQFGLLD